jgi:hypothetical protein
MPNPTRDIDILGRAFPSDEEEITRRLKQIATTDIDDGMTFEPDTPCLHENLRVAGIG